MGKSSEEWRCVVGYEGIYECSSYGRVRSLPRDQLVIRAGRVVTLQWKGKMLSRFRDKDGYPQVRLCKRDGGKSESVHRIVCRAFHGPKPSSLHEVAHADGNKENAHADNLRWATRSENSIDRFQHGTAMIGERHPMARLTEQDVIYIRRNKRRGQSARPFMERFNITERTVYDIMSGRRWAHVGGCNG